MRQDEIVFCLVILPWCVLVEPKRNISLRATLWKAPNFVLVYQDSITLINVRVVL